MTQITHTRHRMPPRNVLLAVTLVAFGLGGCSTVETHTSNAIGGALVGGAAGGAIGTLCCGDPVHGLPAGILIGGIAGAIGGLFWPTSDYHLIPQPQPNPNPNPNPNPSPPPEPDLQRKVPSQQWQQEPVMQQRSTAQPPQWQPPQTHQQPIERQPQAR